MPRILYIETSTRVCSVGVYNDGQLLSLREDHGKGYSHSTLLTVFMKEALEESGTLPEDIAAVAISQGPGSYTGLRIGASAAKGFCYALDKPLIVVNTLRAMACHARDRLAGINDFISPDAIELLYCPMIDARRMEVYYAVFHHDLSEVLSTRAQVIERDTFDRLLGEKKMVFFGDGAEKCRNIITGSNALFLDDVHPSVKGMVAEAEEKFRNSQFVDAAYFEPYYLKDFVAGTPRVKGLYR